MAVSIALSYHFWIVMVASLLFWGVGLLGIVRRERSKRRPVWWWVLVAVATLIMSFIVASVLNALITGWVIRNTSPSTPLTIHRLL